MVFAGYVTSIRLVSQGSSIPRAFGPLTCSLKIIQFVFPCAVGDVSFVRVRSAHFPTPWKSSVSFGSVGSIPVLPRGRRVHSGTFGPFPEAVKVVAFIRVRWLNFFTPWGFLVCVWSIPVYPGDHRVRSCAFDPFPCALGVVGIVRVRSPHSRANMR